MLEFLRTSHAAALSTQISEEEQWLSMMRLLASKQDAKQEEIGFIAGVLVATESSSVRNAAALALADLHAREASASILEVLRRPSIARAAGTLVYALNELGVPLTVIALMQIIEHGSFEARSMALNLVEQEGLDVEDGPQMDFAVRKLREMAARSDDAEGAEAAEAALELISPSSGDSAAP